jgi:hypothetical protein
MQFEVFFSWLAENVDVKKNKMLLVPGPGRIRDPEPIRISDSGLKVWIRPDPNP